MKTLPDILCRWFAEHKRDLPWRQDKNPYHIWLSEIMLQQTRVEAVIPYYERFLAACPTVYDLAVLDEQKLLKLWEGLGYYSRARNLQKAAQILCNEYGGIFPADFHALRSLPGIGDYTAGAIGSIAFGLPVPAVDGNVLRVMARLSGNSRPIDNPKIKKDITAQVCQLLPAGQSGDFNQALMELGATICLPHGAPKCQNCPAACLCAAFQQGTALSLPTRSPKKPRKIQQRTILLLHCQGKIAVRRRPAKGLLAGLWELPAYKGALPPEALRQQLAQDGFSVREILSLRPAKHIFTHIEWHMSGYDITLNACPDGFIWATPEQLRGEYALPSAFRPFLQTLEDNLDGI